MCLAVWPLSGFSGLLQILLLIVCTFLVAAFVITVVLHYRRRKKEAEPAEVEQIVAASPESTHFKLENEYILFDHSGLIRDYKTKLVNNHARYMALKQDFEKLEIKYNSLLLTSVSPQQQNKSTTMEQHFTGDQHQLIEAPQQTANMDAEKNELNEKLENLNQAYHRLENEKAELADKLALACLGEEDKLAILSRWKEELRQVKNKLVEQECMKDMLEEKKSQVDFLQQQLEQRIRNFREAELQLTNTNEELLNLRQALDSSTGQLQALKSGTEGIQEKLTNAEITLGNQQLDLVNKLNHITYLENTLQEIKQQNEMLQAEVADGRDQSLNLQQLLDDEKAHSIFIEQKLASNKRLLQRLFKEFAICMDEDMSEPPIVALRPAYISKTKSDEWVEKAIQ